MSYDASKAIAYALSKVGGNYVFGAAGPHDFDCSGLTMKALEHGGITVEHNSLIQAQELKAVPATRRNRWHLRPGDLVFYYGKPGDIVQGHIRDWIIPTSHVGIFTEISKGLRQVTQATNEHYGIQTIWMYKYAKPSAYAYIGH